MPETNENFNAYLDAKHENLFEDLSETAWVFFANGIQVGSAESKKELLKQHPESGLLVQPNASTPVIQKIRKNQFRTQTYKIVETKADSL